MIDLNDLSNIKDSVNSDNEIKIAKIKCNCCLNIFGIVDDYLGIITCPYCNEYVEG